MARAAKLDLRAFQQALATRLAAKTAAQVEQLHKQYVHKRLLERCGVPRLSLFYMH